MHIKPRKSRIFYISLLLVVTIIFYLEDKGEPDVKEIRLKGGYFIKNIENDESMMLRTENKHIFFIDGDGETEAIIRNARKACNIEAAAYLNPDYTIHLIFLTPTHELFLRYSTLLNVLKSYGNIQIRFMNVKTYCKGTDLENWIEDDPFWKYSREQIAEVMKILSVFKYGGVFMNFKTFSIRAFNEIDHASFACSDENRKFMIYDGVARLDKKFGNKIALGFFERLQKAFQIIPLSSGEEKSDFIKKSKDPQEPKVLFSDSIQSACPDILLNNHTIINCDDIFILPTEKCAKRLEKGYKRFFSHNGKQMYGTKVSNPYFVKIEILGDNSGYLKMSARSAYAKLARKFCPKVAEAAGKFY